MDIFCIIWHLANFKGKGIYLCSMEFGQKLGRGLERIRTGLDKFLHDERGSARPSTTRVAALASGFLVVSTITGYALGLKLDGIPPDQFFSVIDNFRYPDYPYTGRLSFFGELLGGVGAMTIVVFGLRHR